MTFSMTAFARAQNHSDFGQICWEIRSVNHRFLECHMKIPDLFRDMEMNWRNAVRSKLNRGKVECFLNFIPEKIAPTLKLNHSVLEQLQHCCQELQAYPAVNAELKAIDVLKWPQVVAQQPIDVTSMQQIATETLMQAIETLKQNRATEGQALQTILLEKLDNCNMLQQQAEKLAPVRAELIREKLEHKLSELSAKVDRDRLEQEILFYSQKLDVVEELDRLKTHIQEANNHLHGNKVSGKHLDFLMQEFNREANTLASKSANAELTQIALALKLQIEQMREQIQNVE